jgi:hypothetical protein
MIVLTSVDVNQVVAGMDAVKNGSGALVDTFIGLSISVFFAHQVYRIFRSLFI